MSETPTETRLRLQCSTAQDQSSPLTHAQEETGSNSHLTSRGKVLRSKHGRSSALTRSSVQGGGSLLLPSGPGTVLEVCTPYRTPSQRGAECSCLLSPGPELRLLNRLNPTRSPPESYWLTKLSPRLPPFPRLCLSAQVQHLRCIPT